MKKQLTLWTRVGLRGQEIYALSVPCTKLPDKSDVQFNARIIDPNTLLFATDSPSVLSMIERDGQAYLEISPLPMGSPFRLHFAGLVYTKEDAVTVHTQTADCFEAHEENNLHYRLYRPKGDTARPLILFFHGGGECGDDNWRQITGCYGAVQLAETYPDCFVMAPQAAPFQRTSEQMEAFRQMRFRADVQPEEAGWNRAYLAAVCSRIRRMVDQGLVDANRVYITGISMGGGGVLRMLSIDHDLFAASLILCPTMTPETYAILCALITEKLWIMTSYVDHTLYRHLYITEAFLHLRDCGNQNAYLTLFSPEDLENSGVCPRGNLPIEARLALNHMCWIPAYQNACGALDWLMQQRREWPHRCKKQSNYCNDS